MQVTGIPGGRRVREPVNRCCDFWSTRDELRWINHIGQWLDNPAVISERQLLANALEAAQRRANWGRIDKGAVVKRIMDRLTACTLQGGV